MASVEEIRRNLAKVSVIDDHATILEEAVNTLEQHKNASLIDDVLAVFERCDGQDDYGMFSSLQNWMETLPPSEVSPRLRASLLRKGTWKAIEMVGGYFPAGEAAQLLEQMLRDGTFRDPRYDTAWVQKQIDELKASA